MQISFLPWAGILNNIKLGPITFLPYFGESNEIIMDPLIRGHLDNYFKSYIDNEGKPVQTITLCSHGDMDFRVLEEAEQHDLRNAINILTFVAIAVQNRRVVGNNNCSQPPAYSDVFELCTQNFLLGDNYISVRAGNTAHSGWKIGEIFFPRPWATSGGSWYKGYDYGNENFGESEEKILLEGFNKCFLGDLPLETRNRLFRSIEWFQMAHRSQVSEFSKVVMMATAFEILLEFPSYKKSEYFAKWIENKIALNSFQKDERLDNKNKRCSHSLAGWWAWDFYKLRNEITHGDEVPIAKLSYKNQVTHLMVADCMFLQCIKQKLYELKVFGNNTREFLEEYHPGNVEIQRKWFNNYYGFKEVCKVLGWTL